MTPHGGGIIIGMGAGGDAAGVDHPTARAVPRMISAEQFLAALQEKDLLPVDLIQRVRDQLKQADSPPSVEVLVEQFIAEGFLTPMLAKRLLEQASTAAPAATPAPAPERAPAEQPQPEADELGLAPLGDEPGAKWGAQPVKAAAEPSSAEKPAEPLPGAIAAPPAPSSLLEDELKPLGGGATGTAAGGSLDRLMADPMLGGATRAALECALSHRSQTGHHEPGSDGVDSCQASAVSVSRAFDQVRTR